MLPGSSQGIASASHPYVITTYCDRQYACAMPMYGALNCGRKDAARSIAMNVNCLRPIGHAPRTKERPSAVGETERPQPRSSFPQNTSRQSCNILKTRAAASRRHTLSRPKTWNGRLKAWLPKSARPRPRGMWSVLPSYLLDVRGAPYVFLGTESHESSIFGLAAAQNREGLHANIVRVCSSRKSRFDIDQLGCM